MTIVLACVSFGPQVYRFIRPAPISFGPGALAPGGEDGADMRPTATRGAETGEPGWSDLEPVDRASARYEPGRALDLGAPGGLGRLELSADALEIDRDISIVRYEVADHPDATGYALDLLPDGLQLQSPARLVLPLPQGVLAEQAEIVVLDTETGAWIPEPDQGVGEDGRTLVAGLTHFSLRRIRVRPGLAYPFQAGRGRATLRLESDHQNTFQRYVDGRWKKVARESTSYRELMRAGRRGRLALILTGRLRALATGLRRAEVMRDHQRIVSLPASSPHAHTGWVMLHRIDASGHRSGQSVIARVAGPPVPDDLVRAGVVAQLSRATLEALGLEWGREMGLDPSGGELAWLRVPGGGEEEEMLAHLPVELEAYEGPRARAATLPM